MIFCVIKYFLYNILDNFDIMVKKPQNVTLTVGYNSINQTQFTLLLQTVLVCFILTIHKHQFVTQLVVTNKQLLQFFPLNKRKNASKNTLEKSLFTDIPAGDGIKRVIKSNAFQILMRFIGNPFSNRHEESFKEIKFTVAFFQEAARLSSSNIELSNLYTTCHRRQSITFSHQLSSDQSTGSGKNSAWRP